jgi:hypothetical protein
MFGKISTEFLNDLGYDAIAHPQEGIDPLLTLIHDNAESVRLWGPIGDLTQEVTVPLPRIQQDLQATGVSGGTTRQLDVGVGVKILNELLSAMGITGPRAEVGYKKAHTIEFAYENVLIDRVFPASIQKYLNDAKPSIDDNMKKLFDEKGEAFIITDTVKSNSLGTIARDKGGHVIEIDIAAIKKIVGINAKLNKTSDGTVKTSFEGSKYLRFGFKALPIRLVTEPEVRIVIDMGESARPKILKMLTSRDLSKPSTPSSSPKSTLLGKGILFEIR